MGNKKKLAAWFRKEASKLDPEEYVAYHKYNTIQYHQDGDTARPVIGEMQKHPVNHARRLKRLYNKHGKSAVDAYFEARKFKLEKVDEQKENQRTPDVEE